MRPNGTATAIPLPACHIVIATTFERMSFCLNSKSSAPSVFFPAIRIPCASNPRLLVQFAINLCRCPDKIRSVSARVCGVSCACIEDFVSRAKSASCIRANILSIQECCRVGTCSIRISRHIESWTNVAVMKVFLRRVCATQDLMQFGGRRNIFVHTLTADTVRAESICAANEVLVFSVSRIRKFRNIDFVPAYLKQKKECEKNVCHDCKKGKAFGKSCTYQLC